MQRQGWPGARKGLQRRRWSRRSSYRVCVLVSLPFRAPCHRSPRSGPLGTPVHDDRDNFFSYEPRATVVGCCAGPGFLIGRLVVVLLQLCGPAVCGGFRDQQTAKGQQQVGKQHPHHPHRLGPCDVPRLGQALSPRPPPVQRALLRELKPAPGQLPPFPMRSHLRGFIGGGARRHADQLFGNFPAFRLQRARLGQALTSGS